MNLAVPRYELVETQLSLAYPENEEKEWIFRESPEARQVTARFDEILEQSRGLRGLTGELRKFLNRYPWHFDAMNHYAACKLDEGRNLDAFAFAQTSVTTARSAFPPEFHEGIHRIPGGYLENRPFLRCYYQLMTAQAALSDFAGASATGLRILGYDREDRTGARMELPKYLLKQGRYRTALELFEDPAFEGTYDTARYLYPLALLHAGDKDKGREAIHECLTRPRIAKYLLNPGLPPPEPDSAPFFGITGGSELEGYVRAGEFREFWETCPGALKILRQCSTEAEAQGWPALLKRTN